MIAFNCRHIKSLQPNVWVGMEKLYKEDRPIINDGNNDKHYDNETFIKRFVRGPQGTLQIKIEFLAKGEWKPQFKLQAKEKKCKKHYFKNSATRDNKLQNATVARKECREKGNSSTYSPGQPTPGSGH